VSGACLVAIVGVIPFRERGEFGPCYVALGFEGILVIFEDRCLSSGDALRRHRIQLCLQRRDHSTHLCYLGRLTRWRGSCYRISKVLGGRGWIFLVSFLEG
jgi:hypothetical protein